MCWVMLITPSRPCKGRFAIQKEVEMNAIQYVLICLGFLNTGKLFGVESWSDGHLLNYSNLCPYNTFCQSAPQKANLDDYLVPCCEACSCDPNCYETGSCCPDAPVNITRNVKYPCTKVSSNSIQNIYFHVIGDCKNSSLAELHPRCLIPEELSDLAVVSDPTTGKVYKNMHCAICHEVQVIETWDLHIGCGNLLQISLQSMEERDKYIFQNLNECEVFSKPTDDKIIEQFSCVPKQIILGKCNVSKLWDYYDRGIEEACHNQKDIEGTIFSQYATSRITFFANVFCFLCNMPNDVIKSDLCEPLRYDTNRQWTMKIFTAVLRMRTEGPMLADVPEESKCKRFEIWDPYSISCRPFVCPGDTIPEFGECRSVLKYSEGVPIQLVFNLTLEDQIDEVSSYESLLDSLEKKIMTKISTGCEYYGLELHRTNSSNIVLFKLDISSTKACAVHGVLSKVRAIVINGNCIQLRFKDKSSYQKLVLRLMLDKKASYLPSRPIAKKKPQSFQCPYVVITSSIFSYCASIQLTIAEIELIGLYKDIIQPNTTIKSDSPAKEYVCVKTYFKARRLLLKSSTGDPYSQAKLFYYLFVVANYVVFIIW